MESLPASLKRFSICPESQLPQGTSPSNMERTTLVWRPPTTDTTWLSSTSCTWPRESPWASVFRSSAPIASSQPYWPKPSSYREHPYTFTELLQTHKTINFPFTGRSTWLYWFCCFWEGWLLLHLWGSGGKAGLRAFRFRITCLYCCRRGRVSFVCSTGWGCWLWCGW